MLQQEGQRVGMHGSVVFTLLHLKLICSLLGIPALVFSWFVDGHQIVTISGSGVCFVMIELGLPPPKQLNLHLTKDLNYLLE